MLGLFLKKMSRYPLVWASWLNMVRISPRNGEDYMIVINYEYLTMLYIPLEKFCREILFELLDVYLYSFGVGVFFRRKNYFPVAESNETGKILIMFC
jgi:hypothetical protein